MSRFVEVKNTWHLGDWGNKGAYRAGQGEDGFFKAENMVVYDDGAVGPRPGYRWLNHTGMPTGLVRFLTYVPALKDGYAGLILFVIDDTAYWAPAFEDGPVSVAGTLAGTETDFSSAQVEWNDGTFYFSTRNQGVYRWIPATDGFIQVFNQAGIYDLERYKDRLYAGGSQRVYYSDAADFDTWDAALQFFDVGWQFPNYRLASLRNNLFFLRAGGGHYVLSGVPESSSTLRETGQGLPPDEHSIVRVGPEDSVYWIPQSRNAPVRYRMGVVDTSSWEHLEDWTEAPLGFRLSAYSSGLKTTLFTGTTDDKGLLHHNEVWTRHQFDEAEAVDRAADEWFVIHDSQGGTTPRFAIWEYGLGRPGATTDAYAQPGDGTDVPLDAWLFLPEWWHPRAHEAKVEAIEVDFTSWDTGSAETAHFDMVVEALRPRAVNTVPNGGTVSTTYTFDEAVALSSATGDERRVRFNCGEQGWGRGYQIRFTNVRNVSFRAVSAIVDDEPRGSR